MAQQGSDEAASAQKPPVNGAAAHKATEKTSAKRTKAGAKKTSTTKANAKKASTAPGAAPSATSPDPAETGTASFPAAWLAEQERALREERAVYLRQADSLQAEADSLVADFEPGDVQFDEESGEGDSLSVERERDLTLSAQARSAIEEIDHALAKFASGTYGICEASSQPIPIERLEAIPWARERVEYKAGGFGRR